MATAIRVREVLPDDLPVHFSWLLDGQRVVGYWLGREFWGRGIAGAALAQFLLQVPERPLHAHVARHNPASLRVLQKCGFTIDSAPG